MAETIEMKIILKDTATSGKADEIMKKMLKALAPGELDLISNAKLSHIYFEVDLQA